MALFFICSGALSHNHEWNMVYVDGRWWDVDVTANDCGDDTEYRKDWTILRDPAEEELAGTHDEYPQITVFAQELLVPGTSK